jgi:molecular chaperone GrpE
MEKQEDKLNKDAENQENNFDGQEETGGEKEPLTGDAANTPDYKAMYEEANDKFLRLYSEFDNFKKRNVRERMELIKSAGADVLKSILPVLDDFDRAIRANETAQDIKAVKEGFNLINQKLYTLLESKGLKKMEVKGQPLDTDLHEAITQIPAPTEDLKGKVVDVIENGYYLNDGVLRHAKVIVGS